MEGSEQEGGVLSSKREMKAHTRPLATHPALHLHIIAMRASYYTSEI